MFIGIIVFEMLGVEGRRTWAVPDEDQDRYGWSKSSTELKPPRQPPNIMKN